MTHTETDQAEFRREYPDADPLRVRYEVLLETWAELERVRGAEGADRALGTQQEIDAAQVMLTADVFQQAQAFKPQVVEAALARGTLSDDEVNTLKNLMQRLEREQELFAMRSSREDHQQDRER